MTRSGIGGKFRPETDIEGPEREYGYSSTLSLTSTLNRGRWLKPRLRPPLLPGKKCGTHCVGGWVGPRICMNG